MNDEAPRLSYILVPILTLGLIGFALGSYVGWDTEYKKLFSVTGTIAGGFIGWLVSRWLIGRREDFFYYEYNMSLNALPESISTTKDGTVILSLHLADGTSKEIRGLTPDEWQALGEKVCDVRNYSTRVLQSIDIYGATRGSTIYDLITEILKAAKILDEKGTGVTVNDDRGWRFFEQLKKRDYEILRVLDSPIPHSARESV